MAWGYLQRAFFAMILFREARSSKRIAEEIRAQSPGIGFWGVVRQGLRRQYLWADAEGRRHIGWRVPLLIWLLPGLFALATLWLGLIELTDRTATRLTTGTVVQVYAWEGETIFDRGEMQYAPVFEVEDETGRAIRLTPGYRHRDWNFELGSVHEVRVASRAPERVVLLDGVTWMVPMVIGALALGTGALAGLLWWRVLAWRRGGARTPGTH